VLRIVPCSPSLGLSFSHSFGPPAGSVSGGSITHGLRSRSGRLKNSGHLLADLGELGFEVAFGKLTKPSGQAIALGDEFLQLPGHAGEKLSHLGRIRPAEGLTEAPAGYFLRLQLIHETVKIPAVAVCERKRCLIRQMTA
jgi:hypothetical protein